MPTEKDDSNLTRSDVEALITDIVGKAYSRSREDTTKEINGAIAANINPVSKSLSDISKQLESFKEISTKVSATEAQMAEIFTALQAPDEDPTQPATPQAIDVEALTAKIKAEIEESSARTYLERIKNLETGIQEERLEKEKIRQQQIESDRNNVLLASLKKIAPELNLFPDHEDVVMSKLEKDKVLQVSEDGTSWMAKTKRQDPFTKQVEEVVVPVSADILKSIISENYSYYQQPRAGAGVNAAPTQSYNPANRKITDTTSAADIQKGFASNDQGMIDEIAAMIASGQ
jgi:predicted nucleic acid-binding Zn ribbon protein